LYREAQEANRLKDEFLATVSHELRTPLNVILGRTRMILGADDLETALENAEIVERNGAALARLVGDLLDMSRRDVGQIALERQPVHLAPVIESSILAVQPAVEARGSPSPSTRSRPAAFTGDPTDSATSEPLTNAVKFTPATADRTRYGCRHITPASDSARDRARRAATGVRPVRQGEPTASRSMATRPGPLIVRRLVDPTAATRVATAIPGRARLHDHATCPAPGNRVVPDSPSRSRA
jgi:hypothetical protein